MDEEEIYYQLRNLIVQQYGHDAADAADESLADAARAIAESEDAK